MKNPLIVTLDSQNAFKHLSNSIEPLINVVACRECSKQIVILTKTEGSVRRVAKATGRPLFLVCHECGEDLQQQFGFREVKCEQDAEEVSQIRQAQVQAN